MTPSIRGDTPTAAAASSSANTVVPAATTPTTTTTTVTTTTNDDVDSDDDAENDDGHSSDATGDVSQRPERIRRWDHLRKIHKIVVCSQCDLHMPRPGLQGHLDVCPGKA